VFPSGKETEHYRLPFHVMSETLKREVYGLRSPGFSIDQVSVPNPDPLAAIQYSCVYWVDHLNDWQSGDTTKHPDVFQDGGIIDDFLRQHYLYWLEALSLCRSMSQGILSMTKLETILQVSFPGGTMLSIGGSNINAAKQNCIASTKPCIRHAPVCAVLRMGS
jgi:hypothetical protein